MSQEIVISGGGPNGLMLACELALAGVRPVLLEKLPDRRNTQKANGLMGQVVRLMDHRGLFQRRFGDDAVPQPSPRHMFAGFGLDLGELDPNPLYGMLAPQREWEQLLEERARELGVEIRRGHELTGFSQDDEGVTVTAEAAATGRYTLRCGYLVGSDGGQSRVRRLAGIAFPGTTSDVVSRVAHVSLPESIRYDAGGLEIPGFGRVGWGYTHTPHGAFAFALLGPQGPLIGTLERGEPGVAADAPVTFDEIREATARVLGVGLPIDPPRTPGPHYLRRTVNMNTRLAEAYRRGRVLLVGDAAHVHSAVGGPGLNLGTQDAANLAWKLAAEVRGWAPEGLLDTYHGERHPIGERVMMHSLAQLALLAPGAETVALRQLFGELLGATDNVAHIAALLAGSDVRYDLGGPVDPGDGLTGRFVPDFTVTTDRCPVRVAELMRAARPLLLDLTDGGEFGPAAAGWSDRVDTVTAVGDKPPAEAMLIRPDGYVAWAGRPEATGRQGLKAALTTWFGAPRR